MNAVDRLANKYDALMRTMAVVLLFAAGAAHAQQDWSKVEIKPEKLTDNLHVLFGAGGNMALLTGPDGAVLIDDQLAPISHKVRATVALLSDQPVRFVVNTHFHFDHTGGNEAFGKTGSVIVAHENTRKRLSSKQLVEFFNAESEPSPTAALPVVTLTESLALHLNGEDIAAVHVKNAHTDTDVILFFERANVVHMGDVFITVGYPFFDMGNGGTLDGMIRAMDLVLARTNESTRIIPGHGPVASRADLQAYRDMLATVRERVAALIRKGRTQEQILAAQPTREFDAKYGQAFFKPDVWTQRVYVDLRRALAKPKR
jgi:glyoxylase-like metal-dependent hydrolase (beta-lactamase superfamily II)